MSQAHTFSKKFESAGARAWQGRQTTPAQFKAPGDSLGPHARRAPWVGQAEEKNGPSSIAALPVTRERLMYEEPDPAEHAHLRSRTPPLVFIEYLAKQDMFPRLAQHRAL